MRRHLHIALTVLAIALLALSISWADTHLNAYWNRVLRVAGVSIILGQGLNLVNGILGQFSLAHGGLTLIASYVYALLAMSPERKALIYLWKPLIWPFNGIQWPHVPSLICAVVVTFLFGLLIGAPALRLRGDYLTIGTMAFTEAMVILSFNLVQVTNGPMGIKGVPEHATIWWVWGAALLATVFVYRLSQSSYGRALKCIREDETAAELMGINLAYHKTLAFAISAAITGLGGGLLAGMGLGVDPNQFRSVFTFQVLMTVTIGGLGSVSGTVIAAVFVTFLVEWLRILDAPLSVGSFSLPAMLGLRWVVFATLLILTVLYKREGLMGRNELSWDALLSAAERAYSRVRGASSRGRRAQGEK